ncbi:MAG: 4Fe-4S binding protein [Candidatus Geothermincolales bacterium]
MFLVDGSNCSGCGACEDACPRGAIKIQGAVAVIDHSKCDQCGSCFESCPRGAIYQDETALATPDLRKAGIDAYRDRQPESAALSRIPRGDVARSATEKRLARLLAALIPVALEAVASLARNLAGGRRARMSGKAAGDRSARNSLPAQHRHRFRGGWY